MRIAFITTEYTTEEYFAGGLANYLHRVSLFLKKMGHEPEIFVSSNKNEDFLSEGILIHRVFIPKNSRRHPWIENSKRLNKKLKEVNKQNSFDIIQYANWMATGLHRPKGTPSVTRISSFQPLWFKKKQDEKGLSISTQEEKLEIKSLKKGHAVFSPSYFLSKEVEKFINKKISMIETPFEIETSEIDESMYKKELFGKKYLLFFGRISENKGCVEISEIIYNILNTYNNLHFVLIGDNCNYENSTFIDIIKENSKEFKDRIIHFPALKHELLYPMIKNSYAVILPSRVDNLPNTCLESMAQGKIVLGAKGASFEQIITDRKNGFLSIAGDSQSLWEKIKEIMSLSDENKKQIEEEAIRRIQDFSPEKTISKLLDFYSETIKKHQVNNNIWIKKIISYYSSGINKIKRANTKLVMTLLVRDEADVIEKNIEFHLKNGVDFIIATDNGSIDGTREILEKYQKRGLLFLIDEKNQNYAQAEWVNKMGKIALEKYKADIIFHCDADEFWLPESGNLKDELLKTKKDYLKVRIVNILLEDNEGRESFPQDSKYAVINPIKTEDLEKDSLEKNLYIFEYPPKVIFKTKKGFLEVIQGNHAIVENQPLTKADSQEIKILHFPLRSKKHFFQKIINGGSAYEKNKKLGKNIGFHWRRWYESYKQGKLENEYEKLIINNHSKKEFLNKNIIKEIDFKKILS